MEERSMKRLAIAATAVLVLAGLAAAPVAARPDFACPADASGKLRVDADEWWDRSVVGWAEAGIPVYDGADYSAAFDAWAQDFGFADGAAIEAFVRGEQWERIDKNGNGYVCMRDQPNTPGIPGYIFNGTDDNARG
jgi:hypothetical protein